MATTINIKPVTATIGEYTWSQEEISSLKELYKTDLSIKMKKAELRRDALLQKALKSELISAVSLQTGEDVTLYLAQIGHDLFGMI